MSIDIEQNELNEILEEFFTEAEENLDQLEQDLIQLETLAEDGSTDPETVNRIFRVLHTLKGGAGFLGLEKMAKLAHAGENLLDEVRTDKVPVTKPVMDALLQTTDVLKTLLAMSKARQDDAGVDNSELITWLEGLARGEVIAAPGEASAASPAPAPLDLMAEVLGDDSLDASRDKEAEAIASPVLEPASDMVNKDLLAEVLDDDTLDPSRDKEAEVVASPVIEPASDMVNKDLLAEVLGDDTLDPSRDTEAETAVSAAPTAGPLLPRAAVPNVEQRQSDDRRQGNDDRRQQPRRGGEEGGETIRVETARLDKVMNLVGELVLARNTLLRQMNVPASKASIEQLENAGQIYAMLEQLSRVTQDLQMSVLSTRMQPIKKVFDKIPRQVRELKTKLGREVNLIIEGEMTEVDKTLVEELGDPMVHMIRNALDHGIEPPEERLAVGKHPEGTLAVRAFYEGSNVVIQVQEDGKGIDPEKIRQVAVKKGIITAEAAAALSDSAAVRLIMAPGFSTAEKVTDVSGRGVGMDVVNTKIMNMQGTLDIRSEFGVGTCFSIYLPLTLAIVNALVVGANGEGFAVPIGDIAEVIKFQPETRHRVNEMDVIELRGEPLQLFYLAGMTRNGLNPRRYIKQDTAPVQARQDLSLDELERAVDLAVVPPEGSSRSNHGFVVVVREGGAALGVVVDELFGQEEVVVKSVTDMFDYHQAVSGATISGDGKVHMILDVPFLMKNMAAKHA